MVVIVRCARPGSVLASHARVREHGTGRYERRKVRVQRQKSTVKRQKGRRRRQSSERGAQAVKADGSVRSRWVLRARLPSFVLGSRAASERMLGGWELCTPELFFWGRALNCEWPIRRSGIGGAGAQAEMWEFFRRPIAPGGRLSRSG